MPGTDNEGGIIKKRLPNKTPSFGGYSTEESNGGGNGSNNSPSNGKGKRRAGKRPDGLLDRLGEGGKASVIWLVLVIGLVFCLMDALYIARVLDRGPTADAEAMDLVSAERILEELRKHEHNGHQFNIADTAEVYSAHARRQHGGLERIPAELQAQIKVKTQQLADNEVAPPQFIEAPEENKKGGWLRNPFRRRQRLTPEQQAERRRKRQEEERIAEEKRIKMIKMAALEAMKAEHGGKLPDDMIDKALDNDEAFKPRPMGFYMAQATVDGKKQILDLFMDAGLKNMDDSTYKVLPTWEDVTKLYGTEPRIIGLEQCKTFQSKGNPWDHFVSTAGTFNSGTNLMAEMLIHNCHMEERMRKLGAQNRGIRWQVPWGKHTPPGDEQYRLEHKSMKDKNVDANMILPAVTVRDPYYWMQSMCKHHYTASWRASDRCPNLTPSATDKAMYPMLKDKDYYPLSVRYADFHRHHKSLTGLWNDWYNEYKGVEFQRLFVRYEDLLFHPKNVTQTVCHCAGGTMNRGKFQYVVDSAKKGIGAHGSVRTGYIDAIIKYGHERNRYNGYHPDDLAYARKSLDVEMMTEFGYKYHPSHLEEQNDKKDEGEGDGGNEHEDKVEVEVVEAHHKEVLEAPEIPLDEGEAKEEKPQRYGKKVEKPGELLEAVKEAAEAKVVADEQPKEDEEPAKEEAKEDEEQPKEEPKSADIGDKNDEEEEKDAGEPEEDVEDSDNKDAGGQDEDVEDGDNKDAGEEGEDKEDEDNSDSEDADKKAHEGGPSL